VRANLTAQNATRFPRVGASTNPNLQAWAGGVPPWTV